MLADARGLGVTTTDHGALDLYDLGVRGLLGWDAGALERFRAAAARDLVILQRLYFILFWQGRFAELLALTGDLAAVNADEPFMLGLHAFALEEGGRRAEALRAAEAALARDARDAWAVHAFAHALY